MDAAQIHERCGEKIRGAGEREKLGNPKKASAWKAAIGEEPAICGAKNRSEARGAKQQEGCSSDLDQTIGAQAGRTKKKASDALAD
tara:strand:- start:921 stop:1178 length:258 start_codon:yes stop_codon:yes gene_type:complete